MNAYFIPNPEFFFLYKSTPATIILACIQQPQYRIPNPDLSEVKEVGENEWIVKDKNCEREFKIAQKGDSIVTVFNQEPYMLNKYYCTVCGLTYYYPTMQQAKQSDPTCEHNFVRKDFDTHDLQDQYYQLQLGITIGRIPNPNKFGYTSEEPDYLDESPYRGFPLSIFEFKQVTKSK